MKKNEAAALSWTPSDLDDRTQAADVESLFGTPVEVDTPALETPQPYSNSQSYSNSQNS